MRVTPLFLLFFLMFFLAQTASAADNSSFFENITNSNVKIDKENQTIAYTPEPGVTITRSTEERGQISAGEEMIQNALKNTAVDTVNGIVAGVGGVQFGDLNDTDSRSSSEVAVFAVAAHTIDPTRDPAMMGQLATTRDIYIKAILIFGGLLAIFLLFQVVRPEDSAKLLEEMTGTYGYVAVNDMASYFGSNCFWLLLGPGLFFGAIKVNNLLVESQMLSVLDYVAFSSDTIGLYIIMGILWLISITFFAIRLVSIIISTYLWYFYGLGFAIKKLRWAAIFFALYEIGIIFGQFIVVWSSCVVVSYTTSQELAWYSVSFVYLGLFCTIVFEELLVLSWPIIWKLLSPQSLTTAIRIARLI